MSISILAVGMWLLAALANGAAAAEDNEPQRFVLGNGLEIVVIPDHRAPVVTHMIWYRVGAADDPAGKSGLAHFLEHLMFKGTKNAPPGEFSARVAAIGGEENAFTSHDYTAYFQKVGPKNLEMVMRYEADRMVNLILTDAVVLPERDVILEERRQRVDSSPRAIFGEAMGSALYRNHPYGRPVIGWEHEIAALTRQDALALYEKHYRPGNAVLVVAGDVDPQTVLALAEKTYGAIQGDAVSEPRSRPMEPENPAQRRVLLSDSRVSAPMLRRTYLVPSYRLAENGEAYALEILASVMGGEAASRIKTDMLYTDPIAASAGDYYSGGAYDHGEFAFSISLLEGKDIGEAEQRLDMLIERLLATGITDEELRKAQNYLIKTTIFERDSQGAMARLYGSVLTTGGTIEEIAAWPEKIRAVTVDQVNQVARKYLRASNAVTGHLLPEVKE